MTMVPSIYGGHLGSCTLIGTVWNTTLIALTKPGDPRNFLFSVVATAPAVGSLSHVPSIFVPH